MEPSGKGTASWNGEDIELENFWGKGGIKLSHQEAMRATCTSDPERACKLINLATAMGAICVLVHSNDMATEGWPDTAIFVHIDVNRMLMLDKLDAYDAYGVDSLMNPEFVVHQDTDAIMWASKEPVLQGEKIVFHLVTTAQQLSKPWNPSEPVFLSDGCEGLHFPLRLYRTRGDVEACMHQGEAKQLVMTLQLRPVASGAGDKRKRPALLADSRDECEYEE